MYCRNRSVGALAKLPLGALAFLSALSACKGDPPATGSADLTVRSLGALEVGGVVATVSGPALPMPRSFQLAQRGGSAAAWGGLLGSLPVGSNYVFTVSAIDHSSALDYAGSASGITITAGAVATVTITAQQVAPPGPFRNAVPVIDSLVFSSTNVAPGETIAIKATAHDPDVGDTITFAWTANPAPGSFSAPSAATTQWTAPSSEGDQAVVLIITDNHGASTSAATIVHVAAANGRGQADINVGFNTWPVVADIVASPGYIVPGSPTAVTVTAGDADGDPLSYAWTSSCTDGGFSNTVAAFTTFTLSAGAADAKCDFVVTVSDGRGGSTTGQTTLPVGKPTIIEAPTITSAVQSSADVAAGGRVNFSVDAVDPQGGALTFQWLSSVGAISNQVDGAGTSQIVWTASTAPGATFTVSVIVTDAAGASAQFDFSVKSDNCQCDGTGPGNVPVTVSCGQSTCGSDYQIYACSASGWTLTTESCGLDAGPCECNGKGPGGVPVTVACGQSACGSDYQIYACSASGWTLTTESCGLDAGPCECNGARPGGAPVTVACGQSACGSDYQIYACSASGWTLTTESCGLDAGPCECNGKGPGGVPVTAACGRSACGSDYTLYACSTSGWSATGVACP